MGVLRIVHRWLGLVLAAVVCLVAASGGLLLLRDPYYRAVYPALRGPITAAQIDARAAVLTGIESRWQHEGVQLVKFPRPGVNAFQVWLRDGTEAFVDSQSGAVIDEWRWSTSAPAFLFELHAHLLAEDSGTIVNGIAALFLVFMALTGLILWWPGRRNAFRLRGVLPRGTTPRELLRSHAATGALASLPILIFAVTGAGIVFYQPSARVMSRLFDARSPEEPNAHVAPRPEPVREWSVLLPRIDETFPEGRTVFYYPGGRDNARLMFRKQLPGEWHPNGRSYVVIDPYTAEVVQAIDARAQGAGTRVMHALYPVHAAKVGGIGMVALAALTALALTWLAAGGVWTYVRRWLLARGARRAAAHARATMARMRGRAILPILLMAITATPAYAQRVRQVIDGDTISVSGIGVVRLLGVDAPEKTGGYRQAERFGDESTTFLKKLIEGRNVRLEYDGARTDQYKRTLAYVFLEDGTFANEAIIRAGWAEVYRRFDLVRKPDLIAAERDARAAQRGMWATRR